MPVLPPVKGHSSNLMPSPRSILERREGKGDLTCPPREREEWIGRSGCSCVCLPISDSRFRLHSRPKKSASFTLGSSLTFFRPITLRIGLPQQACPPPHRESDCLCRFPTMAQFISRLRHTAALHSQAEILAKVQTFSNGSNLGMRLEVFTKETGNSSNRGKGGLASLLLHNDNGSPQAHSTLPQQLCAKRRGGNLQRQYLAHLWRQCSVVVVWSS